MTLSSSSSPPPTSHTDLVFAAFIVGIIFGGGVGLLLGVALHLGAL